ncbi:MAG: sodium-translocating pyrophosphatase [Negativicutes bacterium]|nr:sodium-translocating pyrophosphatase [Negativicutes bacterium]
MNIIHLIPISVAISILVAAALTVDVFRWPRGDQNMQNIADTIREGAYAFLWRQYKTIFAGAALVALVLYFATANGYYTAIAFLIGAICSGLAGCIGMYVAIHSNIRAAAGALESFSRALTICFRGGAVTGLAVTSLSLLGVYGLFALFGGFNGSARVAPTLITGFGFGASFVALFAQLGGGIYTKAADVGADIVGKVEAGIPEDDERNPAVVADLVGDNVGDCAGRGADLFESTAAENIGAMILGIALYPAFGLAGIVFPLVARAVGMFASIIGILSVRSGENEDPMKPMARGYFVTCVACAAAMYYVCKNMLSAPGVNFMNYYYCVLIGIGLSCFFFIITQYYTDSQYRPVKAIVRSCVTGPATAVIQGTAMGLESVALPAVFISAAILGAYSLGSSSGLADGGLYGTAVATMGMLSTCAYILAMDTFGAIADNAGGIAEMAGVAEAVRLRTDRLDACGNTTKALTKGYAVGSAALATFLLFRAYIDEIMLINKVSVFAVDIGKPAVFVGAFIAAALVFLFCATAIGAVGNAAQSIVVEVRRQFKEMPGIMDRTQKPEYGTCVDIVTKKALKEMMLPGMLVVIVPILVGRFLGAEAAAGFLMVGTMIGVLMALYLNNTGGACDNGKKVIEMGAHGGKGSNAHKAGVIIDTVGDPFKDTAGPSLHVLVKLISTITLVLAALYPIM